MSGFQKFSALAAMAVCVLANCPDPASAMPLGGPRYDVHQVSAYSTDVFEMIFPANETTEVMVSGDGDTDLDLYLFDENGNLIASDTDGSDDCYVYVNPRWTGTFRIEVRNLGSVYNEYEIALT